MELLKPKRVAEMLDINPGTLAVWRHRGEGPSWVSIGPKDIRYDKADVVRWISRRTEQHKADLAKKRAARKQ